MTAPLHDIEISDEQQLTVASAPLIAVAKQIFTDFGFTKSELSIALVDDANIRRLNNQYLQHDYETDVISFVIDATEHAIVGQLIVSTETAQRVAQQIGAPMEHELMLYVVHGTLHLVGLDDTDEVSREKMRAAEADYLGRFDIAHVWETDLESNPESNLETTEDK
jgi:probable rRNA maturation factor